MFVSPIIWIPAFEWSCVDVDTTSLYWSSSLIMELICCWHFFISDLCSSPSDKPPRWGRDGPECSALAWWPTCSRKAPPSSESLAVDQGRNGTDQKSFARTQQSRPSPWTRLNTCHCQSVDDCTPGDSEGKRFQMLIQSSLQFFLICQTRNAFSDCWWRYLIKHTFKVLMQLVIHHSLCSVIWNYYKNSDLNMINIC